MYKARDVSIIQNDMLDVLAQGSSGLTDLSQGSVLYSLIRSFSSIHNNQDLLLESFSSQVYIASATGNSLDSYASDVGLSRKAGSAATGFVLVQADRSQQIPSGLILTEPNTGLQFQTVNPNDVFLSSFAEIAIPISCTTIGELGNLNSGTKLISPTYETFTWIIGSHRTSAGEVCGNLTGGLFSETDDQLRERIFSEFINSHRTTDEAIKSRVLSDVKITWASIKVPQAGYIQVWVDSTNILSEEELETIKDIANTARPAGVLLSVHQADRISQDINIEVRASTEELQNLTDLLTSKIQSYILNQDLGQLFSIDNLRQDLLGTPGVSSLDIILPIQDVPLSTNQVLRLSSIKVTYITTASNV